MQYGMKMHQSYHTFLPLFQTQNVKTHGAVGLMYKPPSIVMKEQLYEPVRTGRSVSESKLEDAALYGGTANAC